MNKVLKRFLETTLPIYILYPTLIMVLAIWSGWAIATTGIVVMGLIDLRYAYKNVL